MIDMSVIEETEKRYQERKDVRHETLRRLESLPLDEVDSPERVAKRLDRIKAHIIAERDSAAVSGAPATFNATEEEGVFDIENLARERILGKNDLLRVKYLAQGIAVARAVTRIRIHDRQKRLLGYGTGFMVSPRLLITNNHVIANEDEAIFSQAEFNFQDDETGNPLQAILFDLDPKTFFVTNPKLDYTVVAVRDSTREGVELRSFGWVPLIEDEGKILLGQFASIIQHPNGETKQLALRENHIIDLLTDFLHYKTDTARGSSGSAVFNDEWEVIALHHSGVPERDDQKRILNIYGVPWKKEMGEHMIAWKSNEGVRISRIVKDLKERELTTERAKLRDEMFNSKPPFAPVIETRLNASLRGPDSVAAPQPEQLWSQSPSLGKDGSATWTIPLTVSVRLGGTLPQSPASGELQVTPTKSDSQTTPSERPQAPVEGNPELDAALAQLKETTVKKYYDKEQDEKERQDYYQGIDRSLPPEELFTVLNRLLKDTHRPQLAYRPGKYVYPEVDLQRNGKLRSIYSNIQFDPEEFIREDFRIEQEHFEMVEALKLREASIGPERFQEEIDLLEKQRLPYNCEHVVCQSWFGKQNPMVGDLHHLFACEWNCNSFRNDIPYYDFEDFEEKVVEDCGKREEKSFEPFAGKGQVARATLYFMLRYPGVINSIEPHYDKASIEMLLAWDKLYPVSLHEKHRNMVIFRMQGNRNPLIDFPGIARKIDFGKGI